MDGRLLVLAAVVVAALAFAAALRWTRWRTSVLSRRRARRGFAGQVAAVRLLTQAGFTVLDGQPRVDWTTLQDGEPLVVELRADYLVERRGVRYVAEVKTGDAAALLGNSATRRQLLEYQLAFEVDGVLLVCPEHRAIHPIEFPALRAPARVRWGLGLATVAVGAALGWAGAMTLGHRSPPTPAASSR